MPGSNLQQYPSLDYAAKLAADASVVNLSLAVCSRKNELEKSTLSALYQPKKLHETMKSSSNTPGEFWSITVTSWFYNFIHSAERMLKTNTSGDKENLISFFSHYRSAAEKHSQKSQK